MGHADRSATALSNQPWGRSPNGTLIEVKKLKGRRSSATVIHQQRRGPVAPNRHQAGALIPIKAPSRLIGPNPTVAPFVCRHMGGEEGVEINIRCVILSRSSCRR
jgi:hypothetical protein